MHGDCTSDCARRQRYSPHHCPGCSVPAQLDSIVPASDNAKVGVSQQQTSSPALQPHLQYACGLQVIGAWHIILDRTG